MYSSSTFRLVGLPLNFHVDLETFPFTTVASDDGGDNRSLWGPSVIRQCTSIVLCTCCVRSGHECLIQAPSFSTPTSPSFPTSIMLSFPASTSHSPPSSTCTSPRSPPPPPPVPHHHLALVSHHSLALLPHHYLALLPHHHILAVLADKRQTQQTTFGIRRL